MRLKENFVIFFSILISNFLPKISCQGTILDRCREVVFTCDCGNPGYAFQAVFRQCHYWFPKEEACTRFQHCLECETNSKRCVSCRPDRYGSQCNGICNCKPGELCNRDTGQCTCPSGSICDKIDETTATPVSECTIPSIKFPLNQQIKYLKHKIMEIEYYCEKNYILVGDPKIICSNGDWSGNPPICVLEKKSCLPIEEEFIFGEIKYIINQPVIQNNISGKTVITYPPKSKILYSCKKYYELNGVSQRQCQSNGEWSGIQPRCKPNCGVSADKIPLIINGTKAELGEWPWQVAISTRAGFLFCGGSLLSEEWVLTAAHCVAKQNSTDTQPTSALKLLFGKYYRNVNDDKVQERDVISIILHENYNPAILDFDIALIRVKPLVLTNYIQPVCLTSSDISNRNLHIGNSGIVTGWGRDETGRNSEVLKKTSLSVISSQICEENNKIEITENMFCAGSPNAASDTCDGDSGGPLVFPVINFGKTRWFLEGIVSWGNIAGCAIKDKYSGFTKVSKFVNWIKFYVIL